jgi:glycosyltransferase involved in cell wall biosynthesis
MPRLLIAVKDRYPPFRVDITQLFCSGLAKQGFDIDWIMQRDATGGELDRDIAEGQNFYLSPGAGATGWLRNHVNGIVRALFGSYDAVQIRDLPLVAIVYFAAARLSNSKFAYWMSFPMIEAAHDRAKSHRGWDALLRRGAVELYAALAKRVLYHLVLKRADHVFVQSELMRESLLALGVPAAKVTAVPMGVNVDRFSPCTIKPIDDCRLGTAKAFVYVGTIEPIRQVDMLVHVLKHVTQSGYDARLVIVGGARPIDRCRMQDIAAQIGISDRLLFTGHLPLEVALRYVRRADICFSPYPAHPLLLTGTPTKLVEYLAMARPVVGNIHPDQKAILGSSGAGLCVPLSVPDFTQATLALLGDPAAAEHMGSLGPRWVAEHRAYANILSGVLSRYEKMLQIDETSR